MNKKTLFCLITGSLFILISLVELILCFLGPIVLDVKSTIFVFPPYSTTITEEERTLILDSLDDALRKSRKYIPVDQAQAAAILAENNLDLKEIVKQPSSRKYAEAAAIIGAEKYTMGYILRTAQESTPEKPDGIKYELYLNIHLTKLVESVVKKMHEAPTAAALAATMRDYVSILDGEQKGYALPEVLYFYALALHILFGILLLLQPLLSPLLAKRKILNRVYAVIQLRVPEILFIYTLLLFIFAYLYALNANMDYVQKFMATGGNLRLAQNTTQERINSALRYLPLMGLSTFTFIWLRIRRVLYDLADYIKGDFRVLWSLPLTLAAALLTALSFPSFANLNGIAILGFISLIPLLMVIDKNSYLPAVFYGIVFGTLFTVFNSYWLGTFSLVSLQGVMIIFLVFYIFFMLPAVLIYKRAKHLKYLVFPFAWVVYDFCHSIGFIGYPWAIIGTSQYSLLPLIQVSALTGVWGVTFLVVLANSVFYHTIRCLLKKKPSGIIVPASLLAGLFLVTLVGGAVYLAISDRKQAESGKRTVRIAMIQYSLDPRKHNTSDVIPELIRLSREALKEKPELIVWPEGSYNQDFRAFPHYTTAEKLREFQQSSGTWLLTGCMEYQDKQLARANPDKWLELASYNSAMLLDTAAEVKQVYHKIHLVPFTEYFPYEKQLPAVYKILKEFDISWWEKGEDRVIFEHPQFRFCTPICFEDVFPAEIADFINDGAQVIMNLSNDYWSLTPVEGKQHATGALFRAVENARPMLRTTTSGLSCYIDINGRIKNTLPYYEATYMIIELPLPDTGKTVYTSWGDWFVYFSMVALAILALLPLFPLRKRIKPAGKKPE